MENLALFISGGGTTATAIINDCKQGGSLHEHVRPRLVISSKRTAKGITRVQETGMITEADVVVIRPRDYASEDLFADALSHECGKREITIFHQAGWAVKTPKKFLHRYQRGINQHPCVLSQGRPDFGGHGMLGRACHLARLLFVRTTNRDFWTRSVAHRVTEKYDEGAVVGQEQIDILPDDDVDTLAARLLPVEWRVQIKAIRDFATAQVDEIPGEEIVRKHEMGIWALCCEMAKLAYPKG